MWKSELTRDGKGIFGEQKVNFFLFLNNIPHTLNWSILAQKPHFNPVANFCMLCNVEKVFILYHPEFSTLNLRNELYGWCKHKEGYLLMNTWYLLLFISCYLSFFLVILICNQCKFKFLCCTCCPVHLKIVKSLAWNSL